MLEPYEAYSALTDLLPPLVKKQRTLEAKIQPLTAFVEQEKAVRADIDALLVKAKIPSNDGVVCNGYDVVHHERAGQSRINQDVLVAQLVAAGLTKPVVDKILVEATERGEPSTWATVKPSKGAKVRR
jgi:hypothetical protein